MYAIASTLTCCIAPRTFFVAQDVARIKMNGMLTMTASSSAAGSAATAYGSVALRQASKVPAGQGFLLPEGGAQLVDLDNVASASDVSLATLMKAYSARNCESTVAPFHTKYTRCLAVFADTISLDTMGPAVWEADGAAPMAGAQVIDTGMSAPRTFTASIVARVNTVPIW